MEDLTKKWLAVMLKCPEVPVERRADFARELEALFPASGSSSAFVEFTRNVIPLLREKFSRQPKCDLLSETMLAFCDAPCGSVKYPGMCRMSLLLNVMTSSPRQTNPEQMVSDQARLGEKLHDREPEAIVEEVERRCPTFFDDLPRRELPPPDLTQKKAFLCNFVRHFFHRGLRKYEKPSFHAGETEIKTVA